MGETGCGKTRLIRFMCELQAGPNGPKNLLLMKVWLVLAAFLSTLVPAKFTRHEIAIYYIYIIYIIYIIFIIYIIYIIHILYIYYIYYIYILYILYYIILYIYRYMVEQVIQKLKRK